MVRDKGTTLAVDGQGLYFYFDRKKKVPVLNDANIAVSRGAIYSLLGPSGCGKTTLLKCIIGQRKPQEGSLKVYGRIPGSKGFPIPGRGVGYMPQDLALYFEMSMEEIIIYFGYLYGMNRQLINDRITFLVDLLDLPEKTRMIKDLSGGQQRRVSFAIALVHKPPMLILDEPTVGVDPLLRQTIWDHLVTLAKNEHLTIIITTHYTEEARQADTVGLMRKGHLLVEKNPEDLIKQHGVITLEEVFLKLCQKENDRDKDTEISHNLTTAEILKPKCLMKNGTHLKKKTETNERHTGEEHFEKNGQDSVLIAMDPINKCDGVFDEGNEGQDNTTALLSPTSLPDEFENVNTTSEILASLFRFMSLTRKNALRLERNIFMIIFAIFTPTLQVVMFCLCLGSDPFGLHLAVVNMDEDVNRYGEKFLHSLGNQTVYQIKYDNITEAYESVRNGETWAALYLGPEFSACIVDRILEGSDASNDTLLCSTIKVYIDKSNHVISLKIFSDLVEAYKNFATELLEKYHKNTLLAELPVMIEDHVYGSHSTSLMEFIAPALTVGIAYVISLGLTAIAFLEEKGLGLFERSCVAGATAVEMLLSLFFVLLIILLLQVILMLTCAFFIFNIPYNGPFFWIVVGNVVSGIGGMTYGLAIAAVTNDIISAAIISVASFFPTILLSGMIWPVEAMPYYLRYFSYCLPLTKLNDSMRSLIARGWSVSHHYVWEGYIICSSWTILFLILSIVLLKHNK